MGTVTKRENRIWKAPSQLRCARVDAVSPKPEVCLCCRCGGLLQCQLHPWSVWRPVVSVRPLQRRQCWKQQVWHERQGTILQLRGGLQVPLALAPTVTIPDWHDQLTILLQISLQEPRLRGLVSLSTSKLSRRTVDVLTNDDRKMLLPSCGWWKWLRLHLRRSSWILEFTFLHFHFEVGVV